MHFDLCGDISLFSLFCLLTNVTRNDDGLPVKGHSLKRASQLPVTKGTGATVAAAPTFQHPVALPCRWHPLDALSRVAVGFAALVVTP